MACHPPIGTRLARSARDRGERVSHRLRTVWRALLGGCEFGVRSPSSTESRSEWSLSPGATAAYGVANPWEAGLRLPSLEATRACQEDTGTIRASGCAPHNPAVQPLPIDAIQRRLVGSALRGTPFPYPRTSIYWLGATFHGLGARVVPRHQVTSPTIGYPVPRRAPDLSWWVDVVTADPGHPAPHCDSPLRGVPCSRPTLLFTIKDGRSQAVRLFDPNRRRQRPHSPTRHAAAQHPQRSRCCPSPRARVELAAHRAHVILSRRWLPLRAAPRPGIPPCGLVAGQAVRGEARLVEPFRGV